MALRIAGLALSSLLALLSGCAAGDDSDSDGAALAGNLGAGSGLDAESVFTSLQTCKKIAASRSSDLNEDWASFACAGFGGYSLRREYNDLRDNVVVLHEGSDAQVDLRLARTLSGGVSHLGADAEWRVKGEGTERRPYALIFRFSETDQAGVDRSVMMVAKLGAGAACITDVIEVTDHLADHHALAVLAADRSMDRDCPVTLSPR